VYRLSEKVSIRHIEADDSYWAFDVQDGSQYELNETAFLILAGLAKGAGLDALGARIAEEYGIGLDIATRDVDAVLTNLQELGLLDTEGES